MRGKKAKALRKEAQYNTIGLDHQSYRHRYKNLKAESKAKPAIGKFPEARRRKSTQKGLHNFLVKTRLKTMYAWVNTGVLECLKGLGHPVEFHPSYDDRAIARFN